MSQAPKENIKVSAIVCAYNEEKYIQKTIEALLACPTAQEVIVVNDGSTDKTEEILKKLNQQIRLISYRKNRGKGYAFSLGVKAARGEIVVFLDAHLKNLQDEHLKKLIQPILSGKANYVLGMRHSLQMTKADPFAKLTGERAYLKRILLPLLPKLKKSRFGVEVYLNEVFRPKWGKTVHLVGIVHLIKREKMERSEVLPAYLKEIVEISKTKLDIRMEQHRQLKKILNPRKIKSLKVLKKKVNQIKDREVYDLIRSYVLPYLKKLTQ